MTTDALHPGKARVPKAEIGEMLDKMHKTTPNDIFDLDTEPILEVARQTGFGMIYESLEYAKNEPNTDLHDMALMRRKTSREQQKEPKKNEEGRTAKAWLVLAESKQSRDSAFLRREQII